MKAKKTVVHFILMGGTIDSRWNKRTDTIEPNQESAVPDYFQNYNLLDETKFTQICMKDSRALTDEDRKKMLEEIKNSPTDKIIITQGRFTMPESMRYLKKNLKDNNKTIVFTSATTPLIAFDFSDAPFNLGYSFAMVQHLAPGIYVCTEGRSFTLEQVNEFIEEGRLHEIIASKE